MPPAGQPGPRPSRQDWQKAIRAELAYTPYARDRAFLMLGAVRVALLPAPGMTRALAGYGRATAFASAVTAVAWIPLGAALCLNNVVFPSPTVNPLTILVMEAYMIAVMMAAGVAARRACPRPGAPVIAGMAAGIVIATLSLAILYVIESVMLKSANGPAPIGAGISVFLPVFGAAFAPLGAALSRGRFVPRTQSRR